MKPQSEKSTATRARIVSAAHQLFYAYGYNATGLDRIAAQAGVTKGNFYYHFDSKEELALEVLEWHGAQAVQMLDLARLKANPSPRAALLELLHRLIEGSRSGEPEYAFRGCLFGNFALELSIASPTVRKRVGRLLEGVRVHIRSLLQQAQTLGELPASHDCEALATTLLATVEGTVLLDKADQSGRHSSGALAMLDILLAT